ncbi:MAG: ribonuclease R [Alphaproteobacteria bacterium]|nr:ribonuclease R [Alphaproteobacteria bacterium]
MKRPTKSAGKKPQRHGRKTFKHAKPGKIGKPERPESNRIIGMLSKAGETWRIQSTNRRDRGDYLLHVKGGRFELAEGQLAIAEKTHSRSRFAREAKLIEVIGDINAVNAVSLIAIAQNEIPTEFPKEAVAEADAAQPVTLANRTDLRKIPLVTIDGADARDFDDAVFAEPDGEGWHLIVAIADVSHYVKPGSALDKTAYERGNSVYFPDRVVPMLPEALSNELCSLKPHVERACMAAHLYLDKAGEMTKWEFVRGVMRSHARLTYEQAQDAVDGKPDDTTRPLVDNVLKNLYGAFRCLLAARGKRGTLELDLPERKVEIENGKVKTIKVRSRLDSHRLIEEFMITANVAAAAQLEGKGGVCLYRVHDKPTELKLEGLRDFLDSIGISLVPPKQMHPRFLTQILENSAGTEHAQVVNEMMLRSQSQALYSPENIGHFGLALAKYAHFTSPIRRYADLIVHRGLIRACKLGDDGLTEREVEKLEDIADHISNTERRAAGAERDATDRFITLFMADRVGATFAGRISGVARFGLFARLDETGADGIIPMNSLPDDYYFHDEKRQALIGRKTKKVYQLAQPVTVRLVQADRLTGSMALELVEPDSDKEQPTPAGKPAPKDNKPNRRRDRRNRY